MNAPQPPTAHRLGLFGRRLDVRIVTLFLGLLLLVQLASFMTIRHSIDRNARAAIATELHTGENLLRRVLVQNAERLAAAARLLASDYGFRAAIASNDQPTILDALDNQGQRIGAGVALYTDAQNRLVASTLPDSAALQALVQTNLRPAGLASTADATVRVVDGAPFQMVTVPVRAPQLIGHVSMGFAVTRGLVLDIEGLAPLRMVLVSRPTGTTAWQMVALDGADRSLDTVAAQLAPVVPDAVGAPGQPELTLDGEVYSARLVPLGQDGGHQIAAVLMRSVDEAVARYQNLQFTLAAITVAGLLVFGAGSLITARRITGPIKQLSESAERLGAGDYSMPVTVASRDEVHALARSFETMRQGMQQREAQIRRLAYWDPLTGLPNRARLLDLLGAQLQAARRAGRPCTVLMLDLDRFKHVNDVLGHAFGDRMLRQVAERLSAAVHREGDAVARLSGDEFAVLLDDADADIGRTVAQRIRQALEQPLTLDDHTVDVSAGVGVASFPAHGDQPDALLGLAEVAMYAAKEKQTGIQVYEPALDSGSAESLSLLSELRTAVDHDQLRLFLQPKVAIDSGRVLGAEALVRWQHPRRGMVAPMRFIPFAEQTGFIRVLTGWVIECCGDASADLRARGLSLKFAINLSTRDLLDQDLPGKVERLLSRSAMDPRTLCLEITESAIMDDPQRALQTLARLHAMGLRLSIDDFGTGYSSLAYLKKLPLHELKIDKSFVTAMERDPADLKIVRSTIDLAHNLGLTVVAEGIEDMNAWALLRQMRCDEGQGYFIAKPMPAEAFAGWMAGWTPPHAIAARASDLATPA